MYIPYFEMNEQIDVMKGQLLKGESIFITNSELENTDFDMDMFSDELTLYKSEDDNFVYLQDEEDDTHTRIPLADLKQILKNIAPRMLQMRRELEELQAYLHSKEDNSGQER